MKQKYGTPDAESPEWTAEEMRQAKRAGDTWPQYLTDDPEQMKPRLVRGRQKAPTKQQVTLRLDRATVAAYRATGRGWQSRIADDLAKAAKRRRVGASGAART